ncbi:hypothetical protein PO124_23830 [Bacillus licheniformis]|nr:hypothetical protein [Bacillus licheniformis]
MDGVEDHCLCLVMAYPAAYLLVKAPTGRLRALFYILLVSPLLTSVVIRTFPGLCCFRKRDRQRGAYQYEDD